MKMDKHAAAKKLGGQYSTRALKLGVLALTEKQRRFIDEYLFDQNKAAAARRAGYAESGAKQMGNKLLRHPIIRAEVNRREIDRARRVDVRDDHILRELKAIAFFDCRSLFDEKTGQLIANPWSLGEDQLRGLINFDVVVLDSSGRYIVKLNPGAKIRALELLGKYNGLFSDRVEATCVVHSVTYSSDFGDGAAPMQAAA